MTIAVIGAGAIGSLVAAYLTKAGQDVVLIGREAQVEAIRQNGLRLRGACGEETLQVKVAPCLDRAYDLVIFTVKTQDLHEAVEQNKSFLDGSLILSSQNGIQADLILKEYFSQERMFSSIVMFGSTYVQPGEVTFNFAGSWIIGKPFELSDDRLKKIAEVLGHAFPVIVSDNIIGMKWLKLFVNFNNCLPALVGEPMQKTFADLDMCRLSAMLLKEGAAVVRQAGIELVSLPAFPAERITGMAAMPVEQAAGILQKTLTALSKEPLYGSILQSIMRGRESEIDYINGEVVRLAKQLNTAAPLNEKVVGLVHRVEQEKAFLSFDDVKQHFSVKAETK